MTGNNIFLVIMILQAAVAFALQPSTTAAAPPVTSVSGTTANGPDIKTTPATIPPVAPPGRGLTNENDNINTVDPFTEPGISTLPVESSADRALATRIQNELIRLIPSYKAAQHQINSQSGNITVQGSVSSAGDSQQIISVIKRVPGVKSVKNNLKIEDSASVR